MSVSEQAAEEHSSDEETWLALFRRELQTPAANEAGREHDDEPSATSTATGDFVEFLRNTVPTALIPRPLFSYLYREANARLDMAKAEKVGLADLAIGEDCLPTWPTLHWDPDVESLHASIQNRLIDFDVSRDLGDLVQRDIVTKGNMKLAEALKMGVDAQDIVIGANLMPTWDLEQDSEREDQRLVVEDDESETMTSQTDNSLAAPSDITVITPLTEVFDSSSFYVTRSGSPLSACDSDDSAEFDDIIELQNLVAPQPTYEEYEEDATNRNIVHNVDVVGGPAHSSEVDLEVYLVEDDDDVADLPGVELAIDRTAFEYYFGDGDAVDVEVPGTQLFCFSGIEEAGSDGDEQGDDFNAPSTQARAQPLPLFDDEELEENTRATLGTINETDSEHSEELTTDEDRSDEEGEDAE
ncbi:hypothetical protein TOPH_03479 [Tolypocladium ophioglossoides CBS 100239]|uniref:Uncharacterized protein n=1 Tax=Tolypocladium ophioglossoides (strain CBS 100239) TaxID=1163406 RepID=A0A0L0ND10_TOLOC|nr:hypothetical protein TOPH_03479 [Tolypocladium ophioglossoides CBS 100239]